MLKLLSRRWLLVSSPSQHFSCSTLSTRTKHDHSISIQRLFGWPPGASVFVAGAAVRQSHAPLEASPLLGPRHCPRLPSADGDLGPGATQCLPAEGRTFGTTFGTMGRWLLYGWGETWWNMVKLRMKSRGQYNLIIHDWEKTLRRPLFGNFWVTWALGDWGNYLKKCWVSGDHTLIGSDDFRSSPTLQRTVAHLEMMKKSWTIRSRFHTFGHRFWALVPKRTQKGHSFQSFHASLYPLVICYIAMVV